MSLIYGKIPDVPTYWALFDLDWTLTRPSKGKIAKSGTFTIMLPNRIDVLQNLINQGYSIGIITNQKAYPQNTISDIQQKLQKIYTGLNQLLQITTNFVILAATTNQYRKPDNGWLQILNPDRTSKIQTFYC